MKKISVRVCAENINEITCFVVLVPGNVCFSIFKSPYENGAYVIIKENSWQLLGSWHVKKLDQMSNGFLPLSKWENSNVMSLDVFIFARGAGFKLPMLYWKEG
jgi:hypothetical protein